MEIMRAVAPDDVEHRHKSSIRRRVYRVPGPNYLWHIDGYDKLKKFGFAIHGCIDGYSRKVIWLKVGPTNNNPLVVGRYFLDAIAALKGLPSIVRADRGTENITIEQIQKSLRSVHVDAMAKNSFLYGKSCLNQAGEWQYLTDFLEDRKVLGSLRDGSMQYLMDFFGEMKRKGLIVTSDPIHIEALRYCYMDIVRRMLDQFERHWNHHRIRSSRGVMGGWPLVLYTSDQCYLQPVSNEHLDLCEELITTVPDISPEFEEGASIILET